VRTSVVTAWFLSWLRGSVQHEGEACLAPTGVGVGPGMPGPRCEEQIRQSRY